MMVKVLTALFRVILGHVKFADGTNVATSARASGWIIAVLSVAGLGYSVLANPQILTSIAPQLAAISTEDWAKIFGLATLGLLRVGIGIIHAEKKKEVAGASK